MAKQLGHTITPLAPSLFTFKISSPLFTDLQGTSFPNAALVLKTPTKEFKNSGPVLITHWGLSGPGVLKLSSVAARELFLGSYKAELIVNWIANVKDSEKELLEYKNSFPKRSVAANPLFLLTQRFWKSACQLAGIDDGICYADLSKVLLTSLANILSQSKLTINGKGEFKEEFVTCGGVNLAEINFKTLESKICENLFFAGEILDIDGVTGGFNFQSAWTTGWHAAATLAERVVREG